MKKFLTLIVTLLIVGGTFASSIPSNITHPAMRAADVMIPIGKDGKKISLLDLSTISKKDLEKVTGRKMTFPEALAFKGAQKKLRNSIDDNGTVTDKKLQKMFSSDGETGFHLGGFALGFLLGLIGVLIAYIINDDKKKNRRKWAWIGCGAWIVISIVLAVAVL